MAQKNIPTVLLVDDQRDIIRLLHSTLDTLGHELYIVEAPSGEEALLEASRTVIDLLVADYRLPGITGLELMQKIRARNPDVKVILITGMTDRKARDEMLNAGALAIFDKPIPLADFLDAVERGLGLKRTILPPESGAAQVPPTLADLLAGARRATGAHALLLLSERGRVLARAGDLRDSSLEVSLISALMAIFAASQKVTRFARQDHTASLHVFRGGDHDLILLPVDATHALLAAGDGLAADGKLPGVLTALRELRGRVEEVLSSLGVVPKTGELKPPPEGLPSAAPAPAAPEPVAPTPQSAELEALLAAAARKKVKPKEAEAFWQQAVEQQPGVPLEPDKLSYEQARKLGLAPEEKK